MPPPRVPPDLAAIARIAASPYRPVWPDDRDDLSQEAWVGLLEALPFHDCNSVLLEPYLVNKIRKHLSRVCASRRLRRHGKLPTHLIARALSPLDQVILKERTRRE